MNKSAICPNVLLILPGAVLLAKLITPQFFLQHMFQFLAGFASLMCSPRTGLVLIAERENPGSNEVMLRNYRADPKLKIGPSSVYNTVFTAVLAGLQDRILTRVRMFSFVSHTRAHAFTCLASASHAINRDEFITGHLPLFGIYIYLEFFK